MLCNVVTTIRSSIGQVGELFVPALQEMPLFYKAVLESPPGTQLFGGIPNPEEEVRLWKDHREKLEGVMVHLESDYIADACSSWLKGCCEEIFGELPIGKHLIDAIGSGESLGYAEKLVREALDGREDLEESLELWLKSVFGSEAVSPWNQLRGFILKQEKDILEDKLEEAFGTRMKEIVHSGFEELRKDINVRDRIEAIIAALPKDGNDFQTYLNRPSTGGVWFSEPTHRKTGLGYSLKPVADETDFHSCLNAYLGPEVSRIRDAVDNRCKSILDDLLCFVESRNLTLRLKELAPFLQEKCYTIISSMLKELEDVLGELSVSLRNIVERKDSQPPSVSVERSLFIGRLLFALRHHSSHIPLILGSPRQWLDGASSTTFENQLSASRQSKSTFDSLVSFSPRRNSLNSPRSPKKQYVDTPRRQIISALAQLFPVDDRMSPKLEALNKSLQELCFRAYSLWITWVSNELSMVLYRNLNRDDTLSATAPLKGWGVIVIKQEQSGEGPLEMKIALPCLPSLYITAFLYQACLEIHKAGGHVLDKFVLQYFAWKLLEKVVGIYENFLSTLEASESRVSDKGILQILLDLRFAADILSGGKDSTSNRSEMNAKAEPSKVTLQKSPFRWKQAQSQSSSASTEPVMQLIRKLSQKLDPIDWATYEPYLWENEKQSYKRYAVLFGFLVQLNRMYTDTEVKYKTNTDSNILRCSTVPRFKYLPISAPALSSRGTHKSTLQTPADDVSSRSPWKSHSNGDQSPKPEFDDSLNFGVATPLLKSFMTQVGSKFGESTSRWGSMLSDGQVGKTAMSTFGDMLPGPAAGLLSSLTSASRFDP